MKKHTREMARIARACGAENIRLTRGRRGHYCLEAEKEGLLIKAVVSLSPSHPQAVRAETRRIGRIFGQRKAVKKCAPQTGRYRKLRTFRPASRPECAGLTRLDRNPWEPLTTLFFKHPASDAPGNPQAGMIT